MSDNDVMLIGSRGKQVKEMKFEDQRHTTTSILGIQYLSISSI